MKSNNLCVAAVAVLLCGSLVLPTRAGAQNVDGKGSQTPDITMQKISLDLESSNLYYGLKLLFSQVKCNFTLDESLKGLTVTAHFTDVPFRIALETLLKSTSTTLTYKVENGIYSVFPIEEQKPSKEDPDHARVVYVDSDEPRVHLIRVFNISDLDIVQAFGGTILNIGLIPGFGRGGTPPGQTQRGQQSTGLFEGGENMYATGHGTIIVVSPPAGTKQ
jgi:hypothetical protein